MKRPSFVALGTNLPYGGLEGAALLSQALRALEDAGLRLERASSAWRSPAWPPGADQPDYINAMAELDVGDRSPGAVFAMLRAVEERFGRLRRERWGPRTLDLDIIDHQGLVGTFDGIQLPHPRAHLRSFVLAPMAELAPPWRHPVSGETAESLLSGVTGQIERLPGGPLAPAGALSGA